MGLSPRHNVHNQTVCPENITVLAVSPDGEDLDRLRDILHGENWTVRSAASFDEAARAVERESPTVVACEKQLPDGDWKDLFQLVTALQDPPPVVVVSRNADENLWAEVLNLGGYDVLAKPFEYSEVSRVFAMASRYGRRAEACLAR